MARKVKGVIFKNGSWRVRCYLGGREFNIKCDSQPQAAALLGRMRAEHREGKLFVKPKAVKPVLLNDYVETWLTNQPAKGKKPVTIQTYMWRLKKHVLPAFGRMLPLADITRPTIKTWAARLLEQALDFDTVQGIVLTLSAVLSEAVEDGLILQNPSLRSGKILKRPSTIEEEELAIFTEPEEQAILEVAQQSPSFYPMVLLLFRAGVRAGELLGLHREDLDFRNRTIRICRNWSHWRLGTPKGNKSRKVDMSARLAKVLTAWIEVQDLEAAAAGKPAPSILFQGNVGGTRREPFYMAENWLRYQLWFPLLKKAGVRRLGPHAARHTFASRLIANGENLKYISEQLGHGSIKITADVYGHLIPGGNRQAVDRLDEMGTKMGTGAQEGI